MSRINIYGQFPIEDIFATWKINEVAQIQQQAFFSEIPHNWSEFCNSVNAQLTAYVNVKNRFKICCYSTVLVDAFYLFFSFYYTSDLAAILVPFFFVVILPYSTIVVFFGLRILSIWAAIKKICQEKSGSGVRYELKVEPFGTCGALITERHFIIVCVDEEEHANSAPVVVDATLSAQTRPNTHGFDPNFIHGLHKCDGRCGSSPINGIRYHAINHPNYDLCAICFSVYKGSDLKFKPEELDRDRILQSTWKQQNSGHYQNSGQYQDNYNLNSPEQEPEPMPSIVPPMYSNYVPDPPPVEENDYANQMEENIQYNEEVLPDEIPF